MKIVSINLSENGSTGKIMQNIHNEAEKRGHKCLAIVPTTGKSESEKNIYRMGNKIGRRINAYLGIISGWEGCFSFFSTIKSLIVIEKFKPDIIHLHNIHGTFINLPMLFLYMRKKKVQVIWTLHDCWSFTGHCPHFTYEKCDKWKTKCNHCPRFRLYPKSLLDNSKKMWKLKKRLFTSIEKMILVTPSIWLSKLVRESYLKNYPIKIINNGIDLDVFKYMESDFRARYLIPKDNKVILGVAFGWSIKKGLDVFIDLSKRLPSNYKIVLVGTNEAIDKILPDNIISIHRTTSQRELAEIYSAADIFVNPTREEVLGLTNIEANACGIPVLTFNTGGSPECIDDKSGACIQCDDIFALEEKIINICEKKPFRKEDCENRSKKFNLTNMYAEYMSLYEKIVFNGSCE